MRSHHNSLARKKKLIYLILSNIDTNLHWHPHSMNRNEMILTKILHVSFLSLFFCFSFPFGLARRNIPDSEKIFQANESTNEQDRKLNNRQRLIHRAKMKSLRLSVAIVAAFLVCWTPYYVSMLIFMFMNPDERVNR